jgi:hypothetical protein
MLPSIQNEMVVTCNHGIINDFTYIGVIPEGSQDLSHEFCGDPETFETTKKCSQNIDQSEARKYFEQTC